ncbi:MAG: hypothetical protein ACTSRA_22455 [Promethearchaeota archaeon]
MEINFVFFGFLIGSFLTGLGKFLLVTGMCSYDFVVYSLYLDGFAIMSMMISNTSFLMFILDVFYALNSSVKSLLFAVYIVICLVVGLVGTYLLLFKIVNNILKNMLHTVIFALGI